MYAVVRRYDGVSDAAEAGRRVNEEFIPLLRDMYGFVAYYWVNAGGGVMVSTSIFEDQAGEEESTKRAADYVRTSLASLLPNPPQVTAGEVVASDHGGDRPAIIGGGKQGLGLRGLELEGVHEIGVIVGL